MVENMSYENICGYKPAPQNYNSWLPFLYEKRLKRLEERQLKFEKLPKLIVLHLFCDDLKCLKHWLDIINELADSDSFGNKIMFFVDDLWAAYVFQWDGFSIHRGDNNFNLKSPPLIYGVNDVGEVHFFGSARGPNTPSPESLGRFCSQLLAGSLVLSLGYQDRLRVPDVELANFNELIYSSQNKDVFVCFYRSHNHGQNEKNDTFLSLEKLAAELKQEEISIYKMNITRGDPPKKFTIQSYPAMFLVLRDNKQNPIRCYDPNSMLEFIAQHSSEELLFFDRHGVRKVHAELLKQMQNFYKKENLNEFRF